MQRELMTVTVGYHFPDGIRYESEYLGCYGEWLVSKDGTGARQVAAVEQDPSPAADQFKLDLAMRIRNYHHNAIWEEQKHFTWLISIILSAQLIVLIGAKLSKSSKVALIFVASVVGVLLATTAFRAQRKEGEYFRNANARFTEEYNAFYPESQIPAPGRNANKTIWRLTVAIFTGKSGVRDYFQFLFMAFAAVFVGMVVFAYIML